MGQMISSAIMSIGLVQSMRQTQPIVRELMPSDNDNDNLNHCVAYKIALERGNEINKSSNNFEPNYVSAYFYHQASLHKNHTSDNCHTHIIS